MGRGHCLCLSDWEIVTVAGSRTGSSESTVPLLPRPVLCYTSKDTGQMEREHLSRAAKGNGVSKRLLWISATASQTFVCPDLNLMWHVVWPGCVRSCTAETFRSQFMFTGWQTGHSLSPFFFFFWKKYSYNVFWPYFLLHLPRSFPPPYQLYIPFTSLKRTNKQREQEAHIHAKPWKWKSK